MKSVQNLFNQFSFLVEKVSTGNEVWQFTISLAIVFVGFLFLELLTRLINRRMKAPLNTRGLTSGFPICGVFFLHFACSLPPYYSGLQRSPWSCPSS